MPFELIEFWKRCDLSKSPYAHPDDWPVLRSNRGRYIDDVPKNFDDFVGGPSFGNFNDFRLHLSLVPVPYGGNLRQADTIVLLLNPGFAFSDYYAEYRMPGFQDRIRRMVAQDFSDAEFPFMWLDPENCWNGGFHWWERKLREVATVIANQNFGGRYLDALRDLSRRVAHVELIPYHSAAFKAHKLIDSLPSVQAAKQFVQRMLITAAETGEKTIIVTRQVAQWGVRPMLPHIVVYEGSTTRGASLGVKTLGGQAILSRYGIHSA